MSDKLDTQALLDKAMETVRMDVNHVFTKVRSGKLDAACSRDLVAYAKLLHELVQDERLQAKADELAARRMSDEELLAKAKHALSGKAAST